MSKHAMITTRSCASSASIRDGAAKGGAGLLKEAFHEYARMYGELTGTGYDVPISESIEIAASAPADTGSYRARPCRCSR